MLSANLRDEIDKVKAKYEARPWLGRGGEQIATSWHEAGACAGGRISAMVEAVAALTEANEAEAERIFLALSDIAPAAALHKSDGWSIASFAVPALFKAADGDLNLVLSLIDGLGKVVTAMAENGISASRTLQYGLPTLGEVTRGKAAQTCLDMATRLSQKGVDPGEVLRLVIRGLEPFFENNEALVTACQATEEFISGAVDFGVAVSLPLATAIQNVGNASKGDGERYAHLLSLLHLLVDVVVAGDLDIYPTLEYGIKPACDFLGGLNGRLEKMLDVCFTIASNGLPVLSILRDMSHNVGVLTEEAWQCACKCLIELSAEGVDGSHVVNYGFQAISGHRPDWEEQLEHEAAELMRAARGMAQHGFTQRVGHNFRYGLPALTRVSAESEAFGAYRIQTPLFQRGLKLMGDLAEAGIEPCLTIEHGLVAIAVLQEDAPWIFDEVFPICERLVASGVSPDGLMRWCLRPILDQAKGDRRIFAGACDAVAKLIVNIHAVGVDPRDVLYYDIPALAKTQEVDSDEFRSFLGRFSSFLGHVHAKAIDGEGVSRRGLPAVAKAAEGHPWLLGDTLDALDDLAAEGYDPAWCMTFGVPAVAKAVDYDRELVGTRLGQLAAFVRQLEDAGFPGRPLFQYALPALVELDDLSFKDCLRTLLQSAMPLKAQHDGFELYAMATPFLIETWKDSEVFKENLEHLVGLLVDADATTLNNLFCLADLQHSAAGLANFDVKRYRKLLERMIALCTGDKALPAGLTRQVLPLVGRLCPGSGINGVEVVEEVAAVEASLGESINSDDFLKTACSLGETVAAGCKEPANRFLAVVKSLRTLLTDETTNRQSRSLLRGLESLAQHLNKRQSDWDGLLLPCLRAHLAVAPVMLRIIQALAQFVTTDKAATLVREVATQRGVRAIDILHDFFLQGLQSKTITSLEEPHLRSFLDDFSFYDPELYAKYRAIKEKDGLSATEQREAVLELTKTFDELARAVRDGSLSKEQYEHELLPLILYHVFPPSVSANRNSYASLFRSFEDHQKHVEALELPDDLLERKYEFASGGYVVAEGASLDLTPWEFMSTVVNSVEEREGKVDAATVGGKVMERWAAGKLGRREQRYELLGELYMLYRQSGQSLPKSVSTVEVMLQYKEFLADGLLEVLQDALQAWRESKPDRYVAICRQRLVPKVKAGKGLVKAIWKTLTSIQSGAVTSEEGAARLERQLKNFAVDGLAALELLADCRSAQEVKLVLEALDRGEVQYEEGKEFQRLHGMLAGSELSTMTRELFGDENGPGKLQYRVDEGGPTMELTFGISKRRAHAVVGFTEGVCTARDRKLWDQPQFFQVIMWGPDDIALGGVHLLLVDEKDERFASLPGINPSLSLLGRVRIDTCVKAVFDYVWRIAHATGMKGIWIPVNTWIHSNRRAVSTYITGLGLEKRATEEHRFSFSPYYTFNHVYVVPQPSKDDHGVYPRQ